MKIRIFVSSVQKELENERIAVSELVALDPFLDRHIDPILFEQLPALPGAAATAYIEALRSSQVYLGILGFEYGQKGSDGLSAMHCEYQEALRIDLPVYFFIKGDNSQDDRRDDDMQAFLQIIRDEQHGHVYKRFTHYQSLKSEIRRVLLAELDKRNVNPTPTEEQIAVQNIAQASDFDARLVEQLTAEDMDEELCRQYAVRATGRDARDISPDVVRHCLFNRGLLWRNADSGRMKPSATGVLLLGKNPDTVFPQARIAANVYGGIERGEPLDRDDIRTALPRAVDRVFQFLKRNMRHTSRIEGFTKVEIDEYPYEAIREAVVNAVAHRDYDL